MYTADYVRGMYDTAEIDDLKAGDMYFDKAMTFLKTDKFEAALILLIQAEKAYGLAKENNSDLREAAVNEACVRLFLGELAKAVAGFDKVIVQEEKDLAAYKKELTAWQEGADSSITENKEVMRKSKLLSDTYFNKGSLVLTFEGVTYKSLKKAERLFIMSLEKFPDNIPSK